MTSCPEAIGWDSGWFWKKAVSWDPKLGEASWDLKLDEANPLRGLRDAPRVCWVRWDGQHSQNCVSLSLLVSEDKTQEGNKSFVPELKKVVSVSRDSYACERFYISVYFTYSYLVIQHPVKYHWLKLLGKTCKKWKKNYSNKLYIHKPESVLENKTHKILWGFQIQIVT